MGRYSNLGKMQTPPADDKAVGVAKKSTDTPIKSSQQKTTGINVPFNHSTIIPSFGEVDGGNIIAAIHKAMREKPQAPASYRLSSIEKKRLEVALFELKMREMSSTEDKEIKTNENEVVRIALNYILDDYKANGNDSVLVQSLLSLRA